MSYPVYTVPAGDVLPVFFDTFAGSSGASITMSGLAVTDIEIYKDGGTTQRASDAGYTLLDTDGIDFDGITGIHGFSIDTGDNTDAGFYTVGAWFHVVVSAITVDGQTVNFIAAAFRLMAAEGVAGVPDVNTTHISDTAQTGNDVGADVNEILTDTGTTLQAELDGIQADTEDIQARLPAALTAGGNIKADALALSGDATAADNAEAFFDGTGYAGTNNVIPTVTNLTNPPPWNAAWDAEVQSEVQDAIEANNLDHLVKIAVDTNFATTVHADSVMGQVADNGAGFDRTTDSLEAIRDNMGTAQTGDSFTRLGAPAGASISADIAAVQSDTNDIQTRLPASLTGGKMESNVGSITAGLLSIKKNTALAGFEFFMADSSDHVTPKTGLTVTATRSIDGAAFASCANAVSEVANGVYKIDLAAGDLNGNVITLKFTATGADQTTITILTQA